MRISDWSSDVCSSDLAGRGGGPSGQEFDPGRGRRDAVRHAVAFPWCRSRKTMIQPVIAIHGGAGAMSRAAMSPEKEQEYLDALNGILAAEIGRAPGRETVCKAESLAVVAGQFKKKRITK